MTLLTRETNRISRARSRGFTLVELLVVISMIAVLMSITLPALTRSQRQGEAVHCLANERQLTLAWMQYAMDFEDRLCCPVSFTSTLKPYTLMDEVYVCKGVQDERVANSYGISNTMGGESRDGVTPYEKLHKVAFPSERMVFVDVESEWQTCFWPLVGDEDIWKWRPWSWPPASSLQGMTARHSDGCNMSFADGHCEYTRWRDSRTLKLIKGQIADQDEASSANIDLEHMVSILTH